MNGEIPGFVLLTTHCKEPLYVRLSSIAAIREVPGLDGKVGLTVAHGREYLLAGTFDWVRGKILSAMELSS